MHLEEVRGVLEEAELSPYQAKAYLALLKLGDASVSEIVENCTVPQPRIYDVLRSLDNKDFIETYEKDSLRARVIDPGSLIDDLEGKSERYAAAAEEIENVWEEPTIGEHDIEVFNGFHQVVTKAIEGIERAEYSITVAVNGAEFLELKQSLKKAKGNDVIINLSIHLEKDSKTEIENLKPYFEDTASEVRHRNSFSPFLMLVDANKSYFGISRRGGGYGMFVRDQALSSMLFSHIQESLWGRWEVVYSDRRATFPKKYTDIKNCLTELTPHFQSGNPLTAKVDGYETDTGLEVRIEGRITDTVPDPDAGVAVGESSREALVIETDGEIYEVGGFGAIVEDIRATSIKIERTG